MNRNQAKIARENCAPFDPALLDELGHQAHVWFTEPQAISADRKLQEYKAILSSEELKKYQRLRFDDAKHNFLVAHALVRRTLSMYAAISPAAWRFSYNQYGRPEISGPQGAPPLRFNLTHTAGLAACVVTLSTDCGVDAEKIARRGNLSGVATRIFAESERNNLAALDADAAVERFFAYWTLREAYCKARGIPIFHLERNFCFEITGPGQAKIKFDAGADSPDGNWQFTLIRPTIDHIVAIALNGHSSKKIRVAHRQLMP